jgi:hypothetical protein
MFDNDIPDANINGSVTKGSLLSLSIVVFSLTNSNPPDSIGNNSGITT